MASKIQTLSISIIGIDILPYIVMPLLVVKWCDNELKLVDYLLNALSAVTILNK